MIATVSRVWCMALKDQVQREFTIFPMRNDLSLPTGPTNGRKRLAFSLAQQLEDARARVEHAKQREPLRRAVGPACRRSREPRTAPSQSASRAPRPTST